MRRWQNGQTIIEVMVAIALSAIILPALATAVVASREGRAQEGERLQATALAQQASEAVRSVREKGWNNIAGLTAGSAYHPVVASNAWSLSAGTETIGNFTRQVVASDVQRDGSGTIVASGGTVDQSTRKLTVTVSWSLPVAASVVLESYYQRYLNNDAWTQTTQADFSGGTEAQTVDTATGGGEVELASTGPGTYESSGTFTSSTFDATASAAYNYLVFNSTEPAGTDMTFQVASNDDNSTWSYIGPDGTSGTSYSANGALRLNTLGRYLRYKATLTGSGTATPALSDVTVNYSP